MTTRLHLPHHDPSPLYLDEPRPELGATVRLRVRVPHAAAADEVHVRSTPDGEPHFSPLEVARRDDVETWWEGVLTVRNPRTSYRFLLLGGTSGYRWLTAEGLAAHEVPDDTDFRLSTDAPPPAWVADAILYQVFPDRFARSGRPTPWPAWAEPAAWDDPVARERPASMRQLYGGDLWGAAERLDHLAELGATGIYLNPIFPASENHRYCATSFETVDPVLGGDEALVHLSAELHRRGMTLVGDLTLNHSGSDHPWFRAAVADAASEEAGFYHWIEHPHRYEAWLGVPSLPKFDHRSARLRELLYEGPRSLAARWLRPPFSLDGWRVDAANMAGRLGEVDDAAVVARTLLDTMRAESPEAYLLAEHCHDASADLQGGGWHGTMDYAGFTRPLWRWLVRDDVDVAFLGTPTPVPPMAGELVARSIDAFAARIPWQVRLASLNLLGSHDTARWRHVAGDRDRALVGVAALLTFPGVPSILYGDEIGLAGDNDDTAREPFPWDRPERWDTSTLAAYRRWIALRREHAVLRRGGFRWAVVAPDVLAYLREDAEERLLVLLARGGGGGVRIPVAELGADAGEHLLGGPDVEAVAGMLALPADGPAAHVWRLR